MDNLITVKAWVRCKCCGKLHRLKKGESAPKYYCWLAFPHIVQSLEPGDEVEYEEVNEGSNK